MAGNRGCSAGAGAGIVLRGFGNSGERDDFANVGQDHVGRDERGGEKIIASDLKLCCERDTSAMVGFWRFLQKLAAV